MGTSHPIHRRFQAEQLVRLRRSDERQRYAASQRRGRIDPNPHQVDAVIFALRRIRDGGCILADEVGLGKTIEAGLVIAQVLAEGFRRILVILPKPLMGQWQNELFTLFGLEAREGSSDLASFAGDGVFLVGREFAGNELGAGVLAATQPFELCVIDEAHEIFAGIYKRFARDGSYRADSTEARMADRVRRAVGQTPVLLLTATPIQNNLAELWGLVQYVEPTGTLLGSVATFREVFCDPGSNDRVLVAEQAQELRRRINTVCQRTLRRQAQEFLERPFTRRRAMLFEYSMSPAEKSLYDDVTTYLMEPNLCAFSGNQRRLLLIGFHRLMASSLRALARSLERVADRLRKMLSKQGAVKGSTSNPEGEHDDAARLLADDLEHEDLPEPNDQVESPLEPRRLAAELERVEQFIQRTRSLQSDGKAQRLIDAVRLVIERGQSGQGSGKIVIFTESLTTQEYLRELLLEDGLGLCDADITLFRGVNDSPRAMQALAQWRDEVERHLAPHNRPSRQVAVRLALVHEFQHHSRVFISTEAGAKGLNLQFCDTLINYDLPWNPQRIEQRIGRCHRYSQQRDVTVINFLAKDNEAQRLLFQILSEKLDLFGQVLDASDVVLHQPATDAPETLATAFGADFETQVRRIHELARSPEDLAEQLRELSESLEKQRKSFEETQSRMASLIESRFDDSVRQVFRRIADELPGSLAELDQCLEQVVCDYLESLGIDYARTTDDQGRVLIGIPASAALPENLSAGLTVTLGAAKGLDDADPLHLGHALVKAAVEEARAATQCRFRVAFETGQPGSPTRERGKASELAPVAHASGFLTRHSLSSKLRSLVGRAGRLVVSRLTYGGFEPVERLLVTGLLTGDADPLDRSLTEHLLMLPARDVEPHAAHSAVPEADLADAIDEAVFVDQAETARLEQDRFDRLMEQIERYADDQALVLRRELVNVDDQIKAAQQRREMAMGPDARATADKRLLKLESESQRLENRIRELESRQDDDYQRWRDHAHRRRYMAPTLQRILDVEFVVA